MRQARDQGCQIVKNERLIDTVNPRYMGSLDTLQDAVQCQTEINAGRSYAGDTNANTLQKQYSEMSRTLNTSSSTQVRCMAVPLSVYRNEV